MRSIRIFLEVARLRSFSLAGGVLGITQSAASQRVGTLEQRLGVALFDRSVRPLQLTPAGEEFARGCRELVEGYEQLEKRVSRLRPQLEGQVLVDAIYSAGIDLLNHLKAAFEKSHPAVTVVLEYKRPQEVHQAVRERRCDLGILSYPDTWHHVAVIPLRDEPMCAVCAPGHPLAARKTVHAAELGQWPMATFEASLPAGRRIRKYLKEHGARPRITAVFDNIDTIKNAVALTDQVSILPRRTVHREEAAGALAVVDLQPALSRPLGIIYARSGVGLTPLAQSFVDYLLQHAGKGVDLVEQMRSGNSQLAGATR